MRTLAPAQTRYDSGQGSRRRPIRPLSMSVRALTITARVLLLIISTGIPARADLLVASHDGGQILRYDEATGAFTGVFAMGFIPNSMALGPDGNLYITGRTSLFGGVDLIRRFDVTTGAFIDDFVFGGELFSPADLVFGPDGNLYVADFGGTVVSSKVIRYDGMTGAFIDHFVPGGSGGLMGAQGLVFGPDGNLYVTSRETHEVLRYDGSSGAFLGVFAAGATQAQDLTFGPDGNLYVLGGLSGLGLLEVRRFDGLTGEFVDVFVPLFPGGAADSLVFGPDMHLYISTGFDGNSVLRFDGLTGELIDTFVGSGSGGLDFATGLLFTPPPCIPLVEISEEKLTAGDPSEFARFGTSVAMDGDTIVVGASGSSAAYVFVKSRSTWTEQQRLTDSDSGINDFGQSVAISGETIVVGFPGDTDAGFDSGSASVFVRTGTTWSLQQKLIGSDTGPANLFGGSVAITGDTIVVGADSTDFGIGAVYVFVRTGTTWSEQQKLTASDRASDDFFGNEVAISGETVIVGSFGDDNAAGIDAGAAYVFLRSGTTWSQQQKLTGSDTAQLDQFGADVSIDGDTVVVGVVAHEDAGVNTGAAYVFTRSGAVWTQQQKLVPCDASDDDGFGFVVSLRGDRIVATSSLDAAAGLNSGSAYIFRRTGMTWTEVQKFIASDGQPDARFGQSVALGNGRLVIGVPGDEDDFPDSGAAYVFEGPFVVNELLTLDPVTTSFDGTPVPSGPAGTFTIRATFTNESATPIHDPVFRVTTLTGGNLLLNADGGPGGVGATLTGDAGVDAILSPDESLTAEFVIGLQTRAPFTFFVDVLGVPGP